MVGDTWNRLPDLVIICQTVYSPDTSSYIIAIVGNMSRSIYNDKIKILNPGEWLNDEVLDYIMGLMLQREKYLQDQNPDQESFFIFKNLSCTICWMKGQLIIIVCTHIPG